MITILILDGHTRARHALASAFATTPDFDLVAHTGDAAEAVGLCREHQPQVVLIDVRTVAGAAEACLTILESSGQSRIVALATIFEPGEEARYHQLGVRECWPKVQHFSFLTQKLRVLLEKDS